MTTSVRDKLLPALHDARKYQELEKAEISMTERDRAKELEEIKTRTMFNMVEPLHITINGQVSTRNFVYLTHAQAFLFNNVTIKKMLGALEIKREPQLCIRLLPSAFGLEFCNSQSRDRKKSGRHSDDKNFIEHGARGCIHAPTVTKTELLDSDAKLLDFMKDVLLPLAISTNAVILMQGGSECDMARSFERACQPLFARYGDKFPCTVICLQSATAFGGVIAAADSKDYPLSPEDIASAKTSIAWQYLKSSKHSKPNKIKKAVENRFGPNVGAWSAYDAVGWCTHYIMTESVVGEEEKSYKRDSSDFNHINMLLSAYFAQMIPTICFTTFGINPNATFGRGGSRFSPHTNLIRREIPVFFLDCRKRKVYNLDAELTEQHPVAKLLQKVAGTESPLPAPATTEEPAKNTLDDKDTASVPTMQKGEIAKSFSLETVENEDLRARQLKIIAKLDRHIAAGKVGEMPSMHNANMVKTMIVKLALLDHTDTLDALLATHPVAGNNDVVLNDSWCNCMLSYFKMILDLDKTLLTKVDYCGKFKDPLQRLQRTADGNIPIDKEVLGCITPLYEKIEQLQNDELANVEGIQKTDEMLINAVVEYLIVEDIRQHWASTTALDRAKIKARFQCDDGYSFYQQAIRDKQNYWHDLLRSPFMKGASVYELQNVKSLVTLLTQADRLPKYNSYEALMIIRDAWCCYDIFAYTSSRMKVRAKISYMVFLLNGLLLTTTAVYGENIKLLFGVVDTVSILGNHFGVIGLILFALSLFGSIIAGYLAYVDPVKRWKELRLMSLHLKRDIWQFRTRSAKYAVDGNASGALGAQRRSAERLLRARVIEFREDCLEKADAQNYDMLKEPADGVFKHGQFAPLEKDMLDLAQSVGTSVVRTSVGLGISPLRRLCCGRRGGGEHHESNHKDDNFYSPVKPEDYLEWRIMPLLRFYRKRLPLYSSADNWSQALLGFNSIVSAIFAYFEMVSAVALVAQASSIQINFAEFNDIKKKLMRYNGIIAALENQILWWKSLTKVEKASQYNINRLVNGVEEMVAGEQQAWLAAYMKREQEAEGTKPRTRSNNKNSAAKVSPTLDNDSGEYEYTQT